MTIAECEKRNQIVLEAFLHWRWGNATLTGEDIQYICCVNNIKCPNVVSLIEFSESPDMVCLRGKNRAQLKTAFNFLKKLSTYA